MKKTVRDFSIAAAGSLAGLVAACAILMAVDTADRSRAKLSKWKLATVEQLKKKAGTSK